MRGRWCPKNGTSGEIACVRAAVKPRHPDHRLREVGRMGFSNALLPAPDFSAAAARIAKGPIPNANSFAGPATGGAGVSPLATDASSSGPNYGGTTPVAPGVQYAGSPAAGRRHARLQRADSERSLAD